MIQSKYFDYIIKKNKDDNDNDESINQSINDDDIITKKKKIPVSYSFINESIK